eukprot:366203-Chlamydomonas_euryale.AAC.19
MASECVREDDVSRPPLKALPLCRFDQRACPWSAVVHGARGCNMRPDGRMPSANAEQPKQAEGTQASRGDSSKQTGPKGAEGTQGSRGDPSKQRQLAAHKHSDAQGGGAAARTRRTRSRMCAARACSSAHAPPRRGRTRKWRTRPADHAILATAVCDVQRAAALVAACRATDVAAARAPCAVFARRLHVQLLCMRQRQRRRVRARAAATAAAGKLVAVLCAMPVAVARRRGHPGGGGGAAAAAVAARRCAVWQLHTIAGVLWRVSAGRTTKGREKEWGMSSCSVKGGTFRCVACGQADGRGGVRGVRGVRGAEACGSTSTRARSGRWARPHGCGGQWLWQVGQASRLWGPVAGGAGFKGGHAAE